MLWDHGPVESGRLSGLRPVSGGGLQGLGAGWRRHVGASSVSGLRLGSERYFVLIDLICPLLSEILADSFRSFGTRPGSWGQPSEWAWGRPRGGEPKMPRAVPALRVWGGYLRQRAGEARGSQKYTPAAALTAHTRPRAGEAKHVGGGEVVIRVKI